jgi:hypothetical protein
MKVQFKYYLHDNYTGSERAEHILDQTDLDMSREEFNELVGRPFYEVELTCQLDTETGVVTVLSTKL